MAEISVYKLDNLPATGVPNGHYYTKGLSDTRVKLHIADNAGTLFPVGLLSESDVLSTLLAGYSVGANIAIDSNNSVLQAFQKLQGQINSLSTAVSEGIKTPLPLDASLNPNYPAASAGDSYRVTVGGRIGGASGPLVSANDMIIALSANAGGTEAAVGSQWTIVQANVDNATESVTGLTRIATSAEVNGLSEAFAYLTPLRAPQAVRLSPLTGYSVGANSAIVATDTVLSAFAKVQGQINSRVAGNGTAGYIPKFLSSGNIGDSAIFQDGGSVGIGTNNPFFFTGTTLSLSSPTGTIRGITFKISNPDSIVASFYAEDSLFIINSPAHDFAGYGGRIRLAPGGLCGINTTAPTNTLDVNGAVRIRSTSNTAGDFITRSATGVLQYRTASQARADIGGLAARTITGSNSIEVTNGDGVAGNPIIKMKYASTPEW